METPRQPHNPSPGAASAAVSRRIGRHVSEQGVRKISKALKARSRRRKPSIRVAALNITSFLDMSFCLLTFLLLSASFGAGSEGSLAAAVPKTGDTAASAAPADAPVFPIRLIITTTGTDHYNVEVRPGQQLYSDFDQLAKALIALRNDPNGPYSENTPVYILPRGDVPLQGVVNTFNAAIRARFTKVGFAHAQR